MRHSFSCFHRAAFSCFLLLFLLFFFQPIRVDAQCGTPIASFPYLEDFEASPGGWGSGGTGNDWAWGAPGKPTINLAASGTNCWVTGGLTGSFYNFGERSYVESPCFNFAQLPHPSIQFKIWWESERQYDGASFQYSLDNGATWTNVGSFNDPEDCLTDNWFNTSSINNLNNLANPRNGWAGSIMPTMGNCQGGGGSNGWVLAKHCLAELAGQVNVRFRFIFGAGTTCNDFDGFAFDDVFIENAPGPVANFSSDCAGNNEIAFADLSTQCPDAWRWDFGDPASGASNLSPLQNPTHTFSGPGLYTVTLEASSICNGAATVTFPIEVLGLNISSTEVSCFGGLDGTATATFDAPGLIPSYRWNTVPAQNEATATHLVAGNYTVTVSGSGFCPISAMVTVTSPDSLQGVPYNSIQALADTTLALGNAASLTGLVSDPGRVIAYQWQPPVYLDCDTCLNTLATPLQTTTYTLFARDTNGCVISDALTVKVLQGSVYIPNVFRPGAGEENSYFTVYADKDLEQIDLLQIYDRWGGLIFENRNFKASDGVLGWDGRVKGQDAAAGVYLYVIQVRFISGVSEMFIGDITVVR